MIETFQAYRTTNPVPEAVRFFPESLKRIILDARKFMRPPENLTVSQHAEKYRRLPSYSKLSGMWKNYMAPFAVAFMDAFSDDETEEISFMKSAQVSGTESMNNMIYWRIKNKPCPIIVMQPTKTMGQFYAKEKLWKMIEDNKDLREVVSGHTKKNESTTLHIRFVGGFLVVVSAQSVNELRQISGPVVISDDIDANEMERGEKGTKEGDPVKRVEKRAITYLKERKLVRISTPTLKGYSRIERYYNRSNQQKYWVPCPHCNEYQILKFDQLKWEKEKDIFGKTSRHFTDTAYYECENCKKKINEQEHKHNMILKGEWRANRPEIKKHKGFWISELYSMFSSWSEIAKEFVDSKDDDEALEAFYNLTLGLPYEKNLLEAVPEIDALLQRNEDYLTEDKKWIPNESLIIVCSVDTQPGGLIVKVKAWGVGFESWLIHREMKEGDPDRQDVWDWLDIFRETTWTRKDGLKIGISITLIDTGGSNTQSVYNYCRERAYDNVIAIKGIGGRGRPLIMHTTTTTKSAGLRIQLLGVDIGKTMIFRRIKSRYVSGHRVMHFTKRFCDEKYFESLTKSEKPKRRRSGRIEWVEDKKYPNHDFDLEVYNLAGIELLNPDFDGTKEAFDKEVEEMKNKTENKKPDTQSDLIQTEAGHKRRISPNKRRG